MATTVAANMKSTMPAKSRSGILALGMWLVAVPSAPGAGLAALNLRNVIQYMIPSVSRNVTVRIGKDEGRP
jgi:hypothetical protein